MMKKFLAFAVIAVMSITLTACATLQSVVNAVGVTGTVYTAVKASYANAPKTVFAARAGYDIALGAAATFKQTVCPSVNSQPFCATAIPALRKANAAALVAFNTAETFVRTHPDLDPSAVIDAAEKASLAFAAIEASYGVKPNG